MFATAASLQRCPFTSFLLAMQVLDLHFEWHMNTNLCCAVIRSLKCITHNSRRIIMHNSSLNLASKHLTRATRASPILFFSFYTNTHTFPLLPPFFIAPRQFWLKSLMNSCLIFLFFFFFPECFDQQCYVLHDNEGFHITAFRV